MPINETVKTLNISITYQPLSMFKWQMYSAQQMRNRFNVMGNLMGENEDEQDQDSIKEAFLETNIYLLVITFVVSILHTIFEFLAFKNGTYNFPVKFLTLFIYPNSFDEFSCQMTNSLFLFYPVSFDEFSPFRQIQITNS